MKNRWKLSIAVLCLMTPFFSTPAGAQWTAVSNSGGPSTNLGVMLLLPDGRVMCKTNSGGPGTYGNLWNILTPGAGGNYANGTWTTTNPMAKTRLYFISQVLADGRVFVAGGEYGTGGNYMEVYNPQTGLWGNELNYGTKISDANSEMLPDGRVLGAPVDDQPNTFIWNPATNTFTSGPSNISTTNESAWLKLPDSSILFVKTNSLQGERYNPLTNAWHNDASTSVDLYSQYGSETGTAILLPDGRAFFIGGGAGASYSPNTAYYTPSGNATNGSWASGPTMPNTLCAPDAAAAMMRDGKILMALSPTLTRECCDEDGKSFNQFNTPTSFWVFDYTNNSFTSIGAPGGGTFLDIPSYKTNMLDLPNGQILYSQQGSSQYYVYTPGPQLNANRPVITNISQNTPGVFTLTGTQITGWSEGASYGDDWQMNTNYPIVRLTNGSNAYYARTYEWNSTAVRAGSVPQTTKFVLPAGLPNATYQLVVIANGIESAPVSFCTPNVDATASVTSNYNGREVSCHDACNGAVTVNVVGGLAPTFSWSPGSATSQSVSNLCPGTYTVTVTNSALFGGCSATSSVTIHNTPALVAAPTATSNFHGYNISCYGGHNGTATANASGGTPPYSYSWNTSPVQTSANATGLSATTYTVTVTDANGCTATGNVTPTQPPPLNTTAAPTTNYHGYNVRCHGGSDGAAEAYPTGGVAPYTYSWSPTAQSTKVATGLMATTYTVTVTDANGCTATANTTLTEPPQLTIDAGNNKTVYYGYPDSACANLTATNIGGGVPPYTLHWSTGSSAATIHVCPIVTTTYYVTVTDLNNCTWIDSVRVCVIDVRCGNNLNKVTICHNTGSNSNPNNTLCVALPAAENHISHGDQLAACGTIKTCNFNTMAAKLYNPGGAGENAYLMAFPNPFADYTTVRFRVPTDQYADLKLYDISGRLISQLYDGIAKGGNAVDVRFEGNTIPAGLYFLILKTGTGETYVSKLTLEK